MEKPYRGESGGWLTSALFLEPSMTRTMGTRACQPIFTLYEDKKGLINFRKTFVALNDPTGYKWAMEYLGDWAHWQRLMKSKWFEAAYEHALQELYTKLRSEGVEVLRTVAQSGDKSAPAAAKYLAELENHMSKRAPGRPSKKEVEGHLRATERLLEIEDEDAARIGLKVITGGKGGN